MLDKLPLIAFIVGVCLSRIGLDLFSASVAQEFHYSLSNFQLLADKRLWLWLGAAVFIGLLIAALPP